RPKRRDLSDGDAEDDGCRQQGNGRKDSVDSPRDEPSGGGSSDTGQPGNAGPPHQEAAISGMVDAWDMKRCTFSTTMMTDGRSGLVSYSPSSSVRRLRATYVCPGAHERLPRSTIARS